jgi:hypothetical protein
MPRYFKRKRIKLTGLGAASQAPNAFATVRCFVNADIHRAGLVAGTTLCTFIRIKFQPNQAEPIEQAVKSAQRTKGPAKGPGSDDAPKDDGCQQSHLIQKEQTGGWAQIRHKHQHGDTGLQCACRTEKCAEPGFAHIEIIEHCQGQDNHQEQ